MMQNIIQRPTNLSFSYLEDDKITFYFYFFKHTLFIFCYDITKGSISLIRYSKIFRVHFNNSTISIAHNIIPVFEKSYDKVLKWKLVDMALTWEHFYMSSFSQRSLPVYVIAQDGTIGDSYANSNGQARKQRPALIFKCILIRFSICSS